MYLPAGTRVQTAVVACAILEASIITVGSVLVVSLAPRNATQPQAKAPAVSQ